MFPTQRRSYIKPKKVTLKEQQKKQARLVKKLKMTYRNHEAVDEFIDQTKYERFY